MTIDFSFLEQIFQFGLRSLNWVYPPVCAGCGTLGANWCPHCAASVSQIRENFCPVCGRYTLDGRTCRKCQLNNPAYDSLKSWGLFQGPLRKAIHSIKYKRNITLGYELAQPLIKIFSDTKWDIQLITPVPLGIARLFERGYNQSALLAKPIALKKKIPYAPDCLHRVRETSSQVNMSVAERQANVADAFKGVGKLVANNNILVIDDVTTSGATLNACATALRNAGANKVYCLTLAQAR